MHYQVLIRYSELGQAKVIQTTVYGDSLADASRRMAPKADYECYVYGEVAITIPRSSILSIQVTR